MHALEQAHRVLRPGGILADLRPDRLGGRSESQAGLPLIYAATDRESTLIGCVGKTDVRLRSYILADAAVDKVMRRGLFELETVERFPFADAFQSLEVLGAFAAAHWRTSFMDQAARAAIRQALDEDRSRRILVIEPLRLNVLRRL